VGGIGVPEEIRVVREDRVPRDALDLELTEGQRVVLAAERRRVAGERLAVAVERPHREVLLVDDDGFGLRHRRASHVRNHDRLAHAAPGYAGIEAFEKPWARVKPFGDRFERGRVGQRRKPRLLHHVARDRLEGTGDVLGREHIREEWGGAACAEGLPGGGVGTRSRAQASLPLESGERPPGVRVPSSPSISPGEK
jgi:hypothetical protein